jgi:hypothetical protein
VPYAIAEPFSTLFYLPIILDSSQYIIRAASVNGTQVRGQVDSRPFPAAAVLRPDDPDDILIFRFTKIYDVFTL